ncbi:Zinc finger BED domain-containing protein 4 [Merluccius polli]|uniref:Zinc finger BED domain-containing protein 4 n=1 Tax=Merluccius polli TaxID=89951 RepID=A0AA47MF24_MERPO|nr:Zinc finger BED domain-containing protein 4 [Merluccius polli]
MPSISMEERECAMQSTAQGTRPSCAGERSVVRTRNQSGRSWQRSSTSTVWPRRTVSSLLLPAMKSWMTTVSSQPPDSWGAMDSQSETMTAALVAKQNVSLPVWEHFGFQPNVTQYLVEEMVPFSMVEKSAFKSMLNKFDKQYECPGKTYFSETAVPKMYTTVKTLVKSKIKNVDYFLCHN